MSLRKDKIRNSVELQKYEFFFFQRTIGHRFEEILINCVEITSRSCEFACPKFASTFFILSLNVFFFSDVWISFSEMRIENSFQYSGLAFSEITLTALLLIFWISINKICTDLFIPTLTSRQLSVFMIWSSSALHHNSNKLHDLTHCIAFPESLIFIFPRRYQILMRPHGHRWSLHQPRLIQLVSYISVRIRAFHEEPLLHQKTWHRSHFRDVPAISCSLIFFSYKIQQSISEVKEALGGVQFMIWFQHNHVEGLFGWFNGLCHTLPEIPLQFIHSMPIIHSFIDRWGWWWLRSPLQQNLLKWVERRNT